MSETKEDRKRRLHREAQARYRQAHWDQCYAKFKTYISTHREDVNEYYRNYYTQHKDLIKSRNKKRNELKKEFHNLLRLIN